MAEKITFASCEANFHKLMGEIKARKFAPIYLLQGEELDGAKKVLKAAALTYVAALAVSLMQLLRFIIMVSGRRRD